MLCVQEEVCGGGGVLTAWPFQGTARRKAVTEMAVLWLILTSVEVVRVCAFCPRVLPVSLQKTSELSSLSRSRL